VRKNFKRRRASIEAIQYDGTVESLQELRTLVAEAGVATLEEILENGVRYGLVRHPVTDSYVAIEPGQWVTVDEVGSFRIYSPAMFAALYEELPKERPA
jgi:hypothetical protein